MCECTGNRTQLPTNGKGKVPAARVIIYHSFSPKNGFKVDVQDLPLGRNARTFPLSARCKELRTVATKFFLHESLMISKLNFSEM